MSRQTNLCEHGNRICSRCVVISDAAKKISDGIRLAVLFHEWEEIQHGWMAFTLADGQTDHTIYPSKSAAISHQSNEFLYLYICLRGCVSGMPAKDAQLFLDMNRDAYDHNMRLSDPEAPDLIPPLARGVGRWPQ